jgi:cell division protein FtsA
MLNNYICALDIGSSKIAAAVARLKKGRLAEIHLETVLSKGMKHGSVVDSIELISCLNVLLRNLKNKSGINIKFVFANISGEDIVTKHSHAIIPLAERGNKVITLSDLEKVNEQARVLGSSLEEEIIHQIPFSYSIDSKSNLTNPLGLYSHKLETDLYLICVKLSALQSLSRTINQAGYELKGVFLSGIASFNAISNKELKNGFNILCDIGSDITEILFFNDGLLKEIKILNLGGSALTEALCETLKIPLDLAEDIKRSYATVGDYRGVPENKEILVKKDALYKPIKQKLAAEVVTNKTQFICDSIKGTVEKVVSFHEINNFILTGRTVLLEGVLEMLESSLGIPVRMGRISSAQLAPFLGNKDELSGHRYLSYLTALGIICQALQEEEFQFLPPNQPKPVHNPVLRAIQRVKEVYQEYF